MPPVHSSALSHVTPSSFRHSPSTGYALVHSQKPDGSGTVNETHSAPPARGSQDSRIGTSDVPTLAFSTSSNSTSNAGGPPRSSSSSKSTSTSSSTSMSQPDTN